MNELAQERDTDFSAIADEVDQSRTLRADYWDLQRVDTLQSVRRKARPSRGRPALRSLATQSVTAGRRPCVLSAFSDSTHTGDRRSVGQGQRRSVGHRGRRCPRGSRPSISDRAGCPVYRTCPRSVSASEKITQPSFPRSANGVAGFLVWGIPMSITIAGIFAKAWRREQFGLGGRLLRAQYGSTCT